MPILKINTRWLKGFISDKDNGNKIDFCFQGPVIRNRRSINLWQAGVWWSEDLQTWQLCASIRFLSAKIARLSCFLIKPSLIFLRPLKINDRVHGCRVWATCAAASKLDTSYFPDDTFPIDDKFSEQDSVAPGRLGLIHDMKNSIFSADITSDYKFTCNRLHTLHR